MDLFLDETFDEIDEIESLAIHLELGQAQGCLRDFNNNQYHSLRNYWSSTALKSLAASSPAHFKHKYIDEYPSPVESYEMKLGSLVHCLVLTPETFDREFYQVEKVDGRTKEGRAAKEMYLREAEGRTVVDREMVAISERMSESILTNKKCFEVLRDTIREASFFWRCPYSGILFRSRVDAYADNYFVELKTTSDASPAGFARQVFNLNYDLQLAHYWQGFVNNKMVESLASMPASPRGYFIAVENEAPYVAECYEIDPAWFDIGHEKWLDTVTKLEAGLSHGHWPSYVDHKVVDKSILSPASWMGRRPLKGEHND